MRTHRTQYQDTRTAQTLQRVFRGDRQLAQLLERLLKQKPVREAQVREQLHAERSERTAERYG